MTDGRNMRESFLSILEFFCKEDWSFHRAHLLDSLVRIVYSKSPPECVWEEFKYVLASLDSCEVELDCYFNFDIERSVIQIPHIWKIFPEECKEEIYELLVAFYDIEWNTEDPYLSMLCSPKLDEVQRVACKLLSKYKHAIENTTLEEQLDLDV